MADAPLSFIQLMRGVSKVHKGLAESIPGARRIPEEMASKVEKMMPLEVLDEYNKRKVFGQTDKGEPYRGVIRESQGAQPGSPGRLPSKGYFMIAPESVADKIARGQIQGNTASSNMSFGVKPISQSQYPLAFSTVADVDQIKMAGQPQAKVYDINAMDVGRGHGPMQYRAMYDMINAGGDVNKADYLTDINVLRRLGNVAPIAMTRQGLRGIVPVSESAKPRGSYSQQLFSQPVDDISGSGIERGALSQLFGDYDDIVHEAMKLTPADLRGMDQDALAGLLYSREAQLTKSYGPEAHGAQLLSPKYIGDPDVLALYDPYRVTGQKARDTSIEAGIGPNTIARTRTTEDALARILRGETPEEIVENLRRVMSTNVQGFKGRYAKGGLASALEG